MLYSMTGYSQSSLDYNGKIYSVEIKSLNARASEIRCKLPNQFRDKEIELRKLVIDQLDRGKIDININIEGSTPADETSIDKVAFKKYYNELIGLTQELGISPGDIVQSILRIPNVVSFTSTLANDEEWNLMLPCVQSAIDKIMAFRLHEGKALYDDMMLRVNTIENLIDEILPLEPLRIEKLRERLQKNLENHLSNQQADFNRLEQEILYYMEKMDITEEKVRLAQHCKIFREELNAEGLQKGRKLGFIAQELGREINTIGAKAQDSSLQQIVVLMKDDLEKLKEQLANIL